MKRVLIATLLLIPSVTYGQARSTNDSGRITGTGAPYSNGTLTLPATGALKYGTTRAKLLSGADGKLTLSNAAGTGGAVLDASSNGTLAVFANDGTSPGTIWATYFSAGAGYALSTAGYISFDALNGNFIYKKPSLSDANAGTLTEMAGNSFWGATTAAKQKGGDLTLLGGIGSRFFNATSYATGVGDTIAFSVNGAAAVTFTAVASGANATQWNCANSNAECACGLYDRLIANPVSGMAAARTNGTCSDGLVGFVPTAASTTSLTVTVADAGGGGAVGVATSGSNGQVLVSGGTLSAPGLSTPIDTDTGIYNPGGNHIEVITGGVSSLITINGLFYAANIEQADLGATCAPTRIAIDTGGATKELCYCAATNTWYCWSATTITGPVD